MLKTWQCLQPEVEFLGMVDPRKTFVILEILCEHYRKIVDLGKYYEYQKQLGDSNGNRKKLEILGPAGDAKKKLGIYRRSWWIEQKVHMVTGSLRFPEEASAL